MKFPKIALLCIIASVFLYSPIVNATSFVLEEGKSIEVLNNTATYFSITNSVKIDYVSYSLSSNSFTFEKDFSSSINVSPNYRIVITNPGTTAVTLSSTSNAFVPTSISTPALIKGTMRAGKNYEFVSTYSSTVAIKNSSNASALFDYVNYNNDGSISATSGIGRNSFLASITIPIKGKTVVSLQGADLNYWCPYDIYSNYITMIERQAPSLIKGVLKAGKNYQFLSTCSKTISVSNDSNSQALYDYSSYNNDGTAQYSNNVISTAIPLAIKGTTVISSINGDINYWYPYDSYCNYIIVTENQNPALFNGIIPIDTSYEFASSYIKNIIITNNSSLSTLYDYANYSSDGLIEFKRSINVKTITVPVAGKTVVTAIGGDLGYWMPYEFYSKYIVATIRQTPTLFAGVLSSGKNYEFTNTFLNDIIISNDSNTQALYDYVSYSVDTSFTSVCNNNSTTMTVKASGKTVVSALGEDITFWYPYDLYTSFITLSETATPALVKGIINAGKSVEFYNTSFSELKIFNNGSSSLLYDYANYNCYGSMSATTFKSEASADNVTVPTNGRTVITALNGNLQYFYPYDLYNPFIKITERENPAIYKGIIRIGKNVNFKNTYFKDIILATDSRSAALKDVANYKFDDSVLFEHNSTTTTTTIYCNGRTVISSLTGDIKYWAPYDIFVPFVIATETEVPALFVGVMKANKNYEFTNTNINKIDIKNDSNTASLNDYVNYANDDTLTFARNTTSQTTTVLVNGKTTVSSIHGDINYWYPYDIFKKYVTVVEKETPALSISKIIQGKKYEFTNATANSIVIKNDAVASSSVVFNYVIYSRDGTTVKSGFDTTGTTTGTITLGIGERVVVTCNSFSTRQIEFYGAYGTFTNNGVFPSGDALVEYSEGFVIQNVTSQLTSPFSVKATTSITNNSDLTKSSTIIIGLYDAQKKLYKSYLSTKLFTANRMLKIEYEFVKDELINGYSIKVFVWDGATSLMPLAKSKS